MKKKMIVLTIGLMSVFILGISQKVNAKFWGFEPSPAGVFDWADGTCAYRTTCGTNYVFWIAVSTSCNTETIVCI